MSKKTKNDDGLAVAGTEGSLATVDERAELAAFMDALGMVDPAVTGLEEAGVEEVELSTKKWNQKGVDANKDPISPNVFVDSVTKETQRTIDAVLLGFVKKNAWTTYDSAAKSTTVHCESNDRVVGKMADGTLRKCANCPDAQWKTKDKKRIPPACAMTYKVVGREILDDGGSKPFRMFFRRTAEKAFKSHLKKHHLGQGLNGADVALFTYKVKIGLEMAGEGTHAVPVIERGDFVDIPVEALVEQAKSAREYLLADASNEYHDDAVETSGEVIDRDAFVDDGKAETGELANW